MFIIIDCKIHSHKTVLKLTEMGNEAFGAWVRLTAFVRENGSYDGQLKYGTLTRLDTIMGARGGRSGRRIRNTLQLHGWLHIDYPNCTLQIPKYLKYQRNLDFNSLKTTGVLEGKNDDQFAQDIQEKKDIKNKNIRNVVSKQTTTILEFDKFCLFWETYPPTWPRGRKNKKAAERAWEARMRGKVDPDQLLRATGNYRDVGIEPQYVMSPARFIGSSEEWMGYLEPVEKRPSKADVKQAASVQAGKDWLKSHGINEPSGICGASSGAGDSDKVKRADGGNTGSVLDRAKRVVG